MSKTGLTESHHQRAAALKLHGLLAHWTDLDPAQAHLIVQVLEWEEQERGQRGLQRRLASARLGRYKPLADFDWNWPKRIDHNLIIELMKLHFIDEHSNVVLLGPNGVGKSTIAQNLAYKAVLDGRTALFTTAADMLNTLAALDGASALKRKITHYARPELLVIDEVGYLSYANRQADLLFEVISQRYEKRSTIITTNRAFGEWGEVFPNAACVTSLIDRLIHHCDIINIEGESWRMKQSVERANKRSTTKKTAAKSTKEASVKSKPKGKVACK